MSSGELHCCFLDVVSRLRAHSEACPAHVLQQRQLTKAMDIALKRGSKNRSWGSRCRPVRPQGFSVIPLRVLGVVFSVILATLFGPLDHVTSKVGCLDFPGFRESGKQFLEMIPKRTKRVPVFGHSNPTMSGQRTLMTHSQRV